MSVLFAVSVMQIPPLFLSLLCRLRINWMQQGKIKFYIGCNNLRLRFMIFSDSVIPRRTVRSSSSTSFCYSDATSGLAQVLEAVEEVKVWRLRIAMQSRTGGFRNWPCAVKVHLCRSLSVNSFSGAVVSPVPVPVSFCALTVFVSEKTHFPLSVEALRES